MMKIQDCRKAYYDYSGKASDITRNLGLAGIAIIWIFRAVDGSKPVIPKGLIPIGALLVIALTLDLFQYIYGAIAWGAYHRFKEKRVNKDEEFLAPPQINWPTDFFFWAKIAVIVLAYAGFIKFLIRQVC